MEDKKILYPLRKLDELRIDVTITNLIRKILQARPGLYAVTGQTGTGKATMLYSIVCEASDLGLPISVILLNGDEEELFDFPRDWRIHSAETAESLLTICDVAFGEDHSAVVVDIDTIIALFGVEVASRVLEMGNNDRWIFSIFATPLVGIDIAYHLRGMGLPSKEVVNCLSGIVSMILVPSLCDECREQICASIQETRLIYPQAKSPGLVWKESGCERCGFSGIMGRHPPVAVVQVDDEVRSVIEAYLKDGEVKQLPAGKFISMFESTRKMAREGIIGIETYKRVVLQNPLLRGHHLLEQEQFRATRIKSMFSRFVTKQVVEKLTSNEDIEAIMKGDSRRVSCLFCDIRGFTPYAERTAPVELFERLNVYFGEIIDIVFAHEGTIDKFIGDSVMVVFGAPVFQEDHELRAVRCAIDIQRKVSEINMNVKDDIPIRVGIAINTGEVAAGCLGNDRRLDYTILGDTVNVASRLEGIAQPGQIVVGPETASAVTGFEEIKEIGTFQLRGRKEHMKVFEVLYKNLCEKQ